MVSFQIAGPPLWRRGKIYPSLIVLEGTTTIRHMCGVGGRWTKVKTLQPDMEAAIQ